MTSKALRRGSQAHRYDAGIAPLEPFFPQEGLVDSQIALAAGETPDRPWGHLIRFRRLEAPLRALAERLLCRAVARPVMLSLKFGTSPIGVPEWVLGFGEPRSSDCCFDEDCSVLAAACGASAATWKEMTGIIPASMIGWIAVDPGAQNGRDLHFDAGAGSVVITMEGTTTWCIEPGTGQALAARQAIPFAVPGKSSKTRGGLLHAVASSPRRVAAVFRSSIKGEARGRPSARFRQVGFDREECIHLLGQDEENRIAARQPRPP